MKTPGGGEISGWWLVVAILVLVAIVSFLPHSPNMQYEAK